jgi:HD-GYP domain-containing protein (c-di-GMP phosphodiesterase class II)
MIADTIDAMTTDRPYRRAMTLARAVEELEKYAGLQFDPLLVKLVAKSQTIRKLLGVELREDAPPHPPRSLRVTRQQPIVS